MTFSRDRAAFVIAAVVFVAAGIVFYSTVALGSPGSEDTRVSHAEHAAKEWNIEVYEAFDVTNERALVGFADNVFVGRVTEKLATETHGRKTAQTPTPLPETRFSVEVLDNIKGQLRGTVTVNQRGGRLPGRDTLVLVEEDPLLRPGQTVLFTTKFDEKNRWHQITTSNYGDVRIGPGQQRGLVEKFEAAEKDQIDLLAPPIPRRDPAEGRP